jgi:geranylgeranyl diphosphate synthase type II
MDVDFETLQRVSEEKYIKMIEFKTAVLLACSLQMGAYIAGASQEDQKKIYEFGRLLGIAFQIQDDYLDTFGDNQLGKRIGGDILNNKKTLLFIASLDLGSKEEKTNLLEWYADKGGKEEEKISSVKSIFESSGAKAYCIQKMKDLIDKSLLNLEAIETTRSKSELMDLADLIIQRRN